MILQIKDGRGVREVALVRRVATLGRAPDCHIQVDSEGVAQLHAVIYRDPQGLKLSLASPEHQVLANGQAVVAHLLQPGDELSIGAASVTVRRGSADRAGRGQPSEAESADLADALVIQLEAFSRSVLSQEEWPRPAEVLLDSLLRVTRAEHGFLLLFEGNRPRIVAARPALRTTDPAQQAELISDSIVQKVLQTSEAVVLDDASLDPAFALAPSVVRLHLSSVMCVPLQLGNDLKGALYVGHGRRPGLFGERELAVTRIFCAQGVLLLESARHVEKLRARVDDLSHRLEQAAHQDVIAGSPQMEEVLRILDRAAPTTITVLLSGETGTGKEVAARYLHGVSNRTGPFLPVNCAAIPAELLESELFGYTRGAFTGATQDRPGLLEEAEGGTLFLDEIGELPPGLQAKLLRVLQDHTVRRLGDRQDRELDLRVVAATNRQLQGSEQFREDLYYRLAELVVEVPPLRERGGDLELLTHFFLRRYTAEFERAATRLGQAAWDRMRAHDWPGNIRELENRLRRAVLMAESAELQPEDLGFDAADGAAPEPLARARDRFVADYVRQAVVRAGGDRARAAQELEIGLRSLYRYLRLGRE